MAISGTTVRSGGLPRVCKLTTLLSHVWEPASHSTWFTARLGLWQIYRYAYIVAIGIALPICWGVVGSRSLHAFPALDFVMSLSDYEKLLLSYWMIHLSLHQASCFANRDGCNSLHGNNAQPPSFAVTALLYRQRIESDYDELHGACSDVTSQHTTLSYEPPNSR